MCFFLFFFSFTIPSTTEIYTLSLHDALPISRHDRLDLVPRDVVQCGWVAALDIVRKDREERRRHPLDLDAHARRQVGHDLVDARADLLQRVEHLRARRAINADAQRAAGGPRARRPRSEEHTSELQSRK